MVQSDTLVGIVGAVILVAVMGGVFAYEYTQAPPGAGTFSSLYPSLDPMGDIDSDGIENEVDDDLDNDGIANDMDNETTFAASFSGSLSPAAEGSEFILPVHVDQGILHVVGNVTYAAVFPAPAPVVPAFSASLRTAEGETVATATSQVTGSTVMLSFEAMDLAPDEYELVVSHSGGDIGGDFTGNYAVHYE